MNVPPGDRPEIQSAPSPTEPLGQLAWNDTSEYEVPGSGKWQAAVLGCSGLALIGELLSIGHSSFSLALFVAVAIIGIVISRRMIRRFRGQSGRTLRFVPIVTTVIVASLFVGFGVITARVNPGTYRSYFTGYSMTIPTGFTARSEPFKGALTIINATHYMLNGNAVAESIRVVPGPSPSHGQLLQSIATSVALTQKNEISKAMADGSYISSIQSVTRTNGNVFALTRRIDAQRSVEVVGSVLLPTGRLIYLTATISGYNNQAEVQAVFNKLAESTTNTTGI